MSSGLIITLELIAVLGVVLGLAGWDLLRLLRERSDEARDDDPPSS